MRHVLAFTRLDLSAQAGSARTYGIAMVALVLTMGLMHVEPLALLAACLSLSLFLPMYFFALDESAHLDTLYSTLPLGRRGVVAGRYLSLATLVGVQVGVGLLAALGASALTGHPLPPAADLAAVIGVGVGAVCALLAVTVPVCFGLGFARAGLWVRISTIVLVFAGAALTSRIAPAFGRLGDQLDPALWGLLGAAAGLVLLALSAQVSTVLYRRRDL